MTKKILVPSCSEYVNHITLTAKEIEFVKEEMKAMNLSEEDQDHILEHFGKIDNDTKLTADEIMTQTFNEGISYIETSIVNEYETLRDAIKRMRGEDIEDSSSHI